MKQEFRNILYDMKPVKAVAEKEKEEATDIIIRTEFVRIDEQFIA